MSWWNEREGELCLEIKKLIKEFTLPVIHLNKPDKKVIFSEHRNLFFFIYSNTRSVIIIQKT